MRKLIAGAVFALCIGAQAKTARTFYEITKDMTPAQREAYRRELSAKWARFSGGEAIDTRQMKGAIRFVNAQGKIASGEFSDIAETLGETLSRRIQLVNVASPVSLATVSGLVAGEQRSIAVVLTEGSGLPTLLIAPEDRWAMVNVSNLETPEWQRFVNRVRRELIRAFVHLAAVDAGSPGSVLNKVSCVEDLDELVGESVGTEAIMQMDRHLSDLGITPYATSTYRQACQEGWAAPPTNDVQRAIWDKVHSPPSKPLKITYDKAAQKPVVK